MKDQVTQSSLELNLSVWNPDEMRSNVGTIEEYFQGFDCFYWVGASRPSSERYADFLKAFNSGDIPRMVSSQDIGGDLEYVILAQRGFENPDKSTLFRIKSLESPNVDETVVGISKIEPISISPSEGVSEKIKRELDAEIEITSSQIIRAFSKAWIPSWFKKK